MVFFRTLVIPKTVHVGSINCKSKFIFSPKTSFTTVCFGNTNVLTLVNNRNRLLPAAIAQLGERQTEDLKVAGSIPACGVC